MDRPEGNVRPENPPSRDPALDHGSDFATGLSVLDIRLGAAGCVGQVGTLIILAAHHPGSQPIASVESSGRSGASPHQKNQRRLTPGFRLLTPSKSGPHP